MENGKRIVSKAVVEPEFDEAERHLHALRLVGHNSCKYV
jgi:hypothetical protein